MGDSAAELTSPQPDGAIATATNQCLAVGAEGDRLDLMRVAR